VLNCKEAFSNGERLFYFGEGESEVHALLFCVWMRI